MNASSRVVIPRFRIAGLLGLALVAGCENTQVAPATANGFQLTADESRLWHRVDDERDTIERSGFVADWPEVEHYLNAVLHRLHPNPLREGTPLYVKVIIDPTMNAFVLPNGAMYIHTGMLARLQNEAQLAAVLGHELTHATHRHALKEYRTLKNHTAFLAAFTAGTGGLGALLGSVGVMASVSGYSQDLEREADQVGFGLMVANGYDPREGPKVFTLLLDESQRSKIKEPYFFASHPKLTERIANYERFVAALPAGERRGRIGQAEYERILPQVLVGNAQAARQIEDFDFALWCAERDLKLRPGNPAGEYELAETLRRRGGNGDAAAALEHYQSVIAHDPTFAVAYRGAGLTAMKTGDKPAAARAFEHYLTLAPQAGDRAYIQAYLEQCRTAH